MWCCGLDFMFDRVYLSPESESQKQKAIIVIQDLVRWFTDHPLEVLRTIHSFDPCMACAVHVFDPKGTKISQVKVL